MVISNFYGTSRLCKLFVVNILFITIRLWFRDPSLHITNEESIEITTTVHFKLTISVRSRNNFKLTISVRSRNNFKLNNICKI